MAQILYNSPYKPGKFPTTPLEIIDSIAANGAVEDYYLVVPTGKIAARLRFDFVKRYFEATGKPAEDFRCDSMRSFVAKLFKKAFPGERPNLISDAYRLALFEEAFRKSNLKYFQTKANVVPRSLLVRLANLVFGLKDEGISHSDLENELEEKVVTMDNIFDPNRLEDVAELSRNYEKILRDKYLDYPGAIKKIVEKYKIEPKELTLFDLPSADGNTIEELFPGKPLILLHGFSEFSSPEINLIRLFESADIPFAVNIDFSDRNGPLFGNLKDTIEKINVAGLFKFIPAEADYLSPGKSIEKKRSRSRYIRQWLFNKKKAPEKFDFQHIFKACAADNRLDEVRSIVKLVKWKIQKEGYKPHEICVAYRRPLEYADLFRDEFKINGVAANISDRFNLAASPPANAIISALECEANEFRLRDVIKTLKSPYLDFDSPEGEIDADNFQRCAEMMRINQNFGIRKKGWITKFEKKIESYKSILRKINAARDVEPSNIQEIRDKIEIFEKALKDLRIFFKFFDFEKKGESRESDYIIKGNSKIVKYLPSAFADIIEDNIVRKLKVREKIAERYDRIEKYSPNISHFKLNIYREEVEKEARALKEFLRLSREMEYIISDRFPKEAFPIKTLLENLKIAVSEGKYQVRERRNYAVDVTSIEQTRQIPYKIMILCGAVEGEFPIAYRSEILLGKELSGSQERHSRAERTLFYQFLTNNPAALDSGEVELYAFYPKRIGDDDSIRSNFIDEFIKIADRSKSILYNLNEIRKALYKNGENMDFEAKTLREFEWLSAATSKSDLYKTVQKPLDFELERIATPAERNAVLQNIEYVSDFVADAGERNLIDREKLSESRKKKLAEMKNVSVSVSALESYKKCPKKFFIEKYLEIKTVDKIDFFLTALETGSINHKILYRFFSRLQNLELERKDAFVVRSSEKNAPPIIRVDLEHFDKEFLYDTLKSIAKEEFEQIEFDHPFFELEKSLLFADPGGALRLWLNMEFDRYRANWKSRPALFEFAFGKNAKYGLSGFSQPARLSEKVKLDGKIDRLEINIENDSDFIVCDYKSSKNSASTNADYVNGKRFQTTLYAMAAEKFLCEKYDLPAKCYGGAFLLLRPDTSAKNPQTYISALSSDKKTLTEKAPGNIEEISKLCEHSLAAAEEILDDIEKGVFPLEPEDRQCDYCNFGSICRIFEKK